MVEKKVVVEPVAAHVVQLDNFFVNDELEPTERTGSEISDKCHDGVVACWCLIRLSRRPYRHFLLVSLSLVLAGSHSRRR